MSTITFLYIGDQADNYGTQVLREALSEYGTLQESREAEIASSVQKQFYSVAIVDAGAVSAAPEVVSQIRALSPNSKIVVITASYHWKIAKAVIQAGAADYLLKSLDRREILENFKAILK